MTKKYSLEELYKKGIVSSTVIISRDAKEKVLTLQKSGMQYTECIRHVAQELGLSKRSIYRAMRTDL